MDKIIKKIPSTIIFYLGILGLLFLFFFIANTYEFGIPENVSTCLHVAFIMTWLVGIYGGMCFFECEPYIIQFLPIIVVFLISLIDFKFSAKSDRSSVAKLKKIAIIFFVSVLVINCVVYIASIVLTKVYMSKMVKEYENRHLFSAEMQVDLDDVVLDLNNDRYISYDVKSLTSDPEQCFVVSKDGTKYCIVKNNDRKVPVSSQYFYPNANIYLVAHNLKDKREFVNIDPIYEPKHIVVFDSFIYIKGLGGDTTVLVDIETGRVYYDDEIFDGKSYSSDFKVNKEILNKKNNIVEAVETHFDVCTSCNRSKDTTDNIHQNQTVDNHDTQNVTQNVINSDEQKTTESTQKSVLNHIAQQMIDSNTIASSLSNLCHSKETDCPKNVFYKWREDKTGSMIAFLSDSSDDKWKENPFEYSSQIYKVDIKNGDVFKKNQFDGSFYYLLNIFD